MGTRFRDYNRVKATANGHRRYPINDLKETLGLTVFLVTHDLDTLHATCDRIAVLAEKHVILVGTIDDMLRSSHPWIHEYFHGPRARAALAGK